MQPNHTYMIYIYFPFQPKCTASILVYMSIEFTFLTSLLVMVGQWLGNFANKGTALRG